MTDFEKNKELQQNQILHVVKVASLCFSALAIFQYQTKGNYTSMFVTKDLYVLFTSLIVVLVVYVFWNFLQSRRRNNYLFATWVEPCIFLIISSICVLLTGAHESNYKYLFIFVIVSSSIASGMKLGMAVASISSTVILGIDLIATDNTVNAHFESDLVLAFAFLSISWTIGFYAQMEKKHISTLKDMVNLDGLTGLYNHRYFYDSLTKEIEEAKKNGTSLALIFIDLDYFKVYNDINGHQKGDDVLKALSIELVKHFQGSIVSRYGGEEFAVILSNTTEQEAFESGDQFRQKIQEYYFPGQEYMPTKNLTISVGVAVLSPNQKSDVDIIKNADEALYNAKFLRKNRVERYYSILEDLQNTVDKDDREIIISIKTLIAVIDAKDKYTSRHVKSVVSYCLLMADKLRFHEQMKKTLIYAAYMHDIGKINIPQEILMKATPLTKDEWETLKSHPKNGAEIIKNVSILREVIPIILQHHEKYDGSGYPNRLRGDEISYLARVLTVIDSFDAMTSNRPYQKKKSIHEAIHELLRCKGTHFDPNVVDQFVKIVKDELDE